MLTSDNIAEIVRGAQAAAVDDSLWEGWANSIVRMVGSTGGLFGIIDQKAKAMQRTHPIFENIRGYEEYMEGMGARDPQVVRCMTLRGSSIYTDDEHLDLSNPSVRDYMRWQEDRLNFSSHITLTAQADANHVSAFSIHFARQYGERARRLKAAYKRFLPDVANAMRLGFVLSDYLTQSYWEGAQSLMDDRAAFLLSEYGRVMKVNAKAEELLRDRSSLGMRHSYLTCHKPELDSKLQALIAAATARFDPRGGTIRLDAAMGERPTIAEIFPIHRSRRTMAVSEAAAILVVNSASVVKPMGHQRLIDAFGLTAAEDRVAEYLMRGETDGAIAYRLGIAVSTVRTHVKVILAKTQTRTKAELAHLLTLVAR